MGKLLILHYYNPWGTFDLLPGERWPVDIAEDELYEFRLQLLRDRHTGQLVGFSNEGSDLAQDYPRLMELLEAHPVPGRYDVPDLGLTDATLPEIITAIYEHYVVGQEPEFVYPAVERVPAPQVAEGEPEERTSEVEH